MEQFDSTRIREGMTVYGSEGDKLGKVQFRDRDTFVIEKGVFFPRDYLVRYQDIADIQGDDIRLSRTKDEISRGIEAAGRDLTAEPASSGAAVSPAAGQAATGYATSSETVKMPLAEEELEIEKRERQAGEVTLRKDVVTEQRHVEVPVTREEVHVERMPVSGAEAAAPGEGAFQEKTVAVPVYEEEVEIHKRPVVREEVRVRKDRTVEQRAAEVEVRKERIDVEGEPEAGRRDPDER